MLAKISDLKGRLKVSSYVILIYSKLYKTLRLPKLYKGNVRNEHAGNIQYNCKKNWNLKTDKKDLDNCPKTFVSLFPCFFSKKLILVEVLPLLEQIYFFLWSVHVDIIYMSRRCCTKNKGCWNSNWKSSFYRFSWHTKNIQNSVPFTFG